MIIGKEKMSRTEPTQLIETDQESAFISRVLAPSSQFDLDSLQNSLNKHKAEIDADFKKHFVSKKEDLLVSRVYALSRTGISDL